MRPYLALLQHDHGRLWLKVYGAGSREGAIQILMAAEGCPRRAILRLKQARRGRRTPF